MRMMHTNANLFGWLLQANMGVLGFYLDFVYQAYSEKLGVITGIIYNIAVVLGLSAIVLGNVKNVSTAKFLHMIT